MYRSILDLDREKSLKSQLNPPKKEEDDGEPKLKDDPKYSELKLCALQNMMLATLFFL